MKPKMTRIYLTMSNDEWLRLSKEAEEEYRHPRDHARYLLRAALGLTPDVQTQSNANRAGQVIEATPSAIASK
jgi:hypothetical protein